MSSTLLYTYRSAGAKAKSNAHISAMRLLFSLCNSRHQSNPDCIGTIIMSIPRLSGRWKTAMNQKNSSDTPQFDYFLDYKCHWLQALDLLKYQLETKKENRHFNTLEMFYYEKLEKFFKRLESERYFNTRIVNNLFYGLKEFAVVPYTRPKSNLGLRRYNFMTCPMRVLYYAVGLYLLELSQEYLQDYKSHEHIQANYGGKLHLEAGKLNLNLNSIYYQPHYKKFRNRLRQEIKGNPQRKVIIYLDIANYFDELSIPKLLDLLEKRVKPSIQKRMRYDATTQAHEVPSLIWATNHRL